MKRHIVKSLKDWAKGYSFWVHTLSRVPDIMINQTGDEMYLIDFAYSPVVIMACNEKSYWKKFACIQDGDRYYLFVWDTCSRLYQIALNRVKAKDRMKDEFDFEVSKQLILPVRPNDIIKPIKEITLYDVRKIDWILFVKVFARACSCLASQSTANEGKRAYIVCIKEEERLHA